MANYTKARLALFRADAEKQIQFHANRRLSMTEQQHPITPPPELVQEWVTEIWHEGTPVQVAASDLHIAARAAKWGADAELEACSECMDGWGDIHNSYGYELAEDLRAARRPKPPSLAEEALSAQQRMWIGQSTHGDWELVRRALERLQQLENPND